MSAPSPPNIYIRPKCLLDSVVLYWRAPVSSGGSDVIVYTVTCDDPAYSQTLPGNAYQLTIPSLSLGTDYTFQITATNDAGTSAPATFRTVQVGLKPSAVQNVAASTSASTSAYVTWDFSANEGEAPSNWFVLTAIPSTVGVAVIKKSAHGYERNRSVFGLAPSNSYQILVQAVNDVGYAPPTAISNAITTGTSGGGLPPPPPLTYWLPSVVTGLQAWYDGSDPLGTGSFPDPGAAVPTWYDKSGNSRNAVATGSPQFQTYSLNSLSGIAYVGNNSATVYYTAPIPAGTFSAATTFFIVYKSTQNNTANALVSRGGPVGTSGNPDINSSGIAVQNTASQYGYNGYSGAAIYNTTPSLFEITVDQYGNNVSQWINGSSVTVNYEGYGPLTPGTADATNDSLYIGTRRGLDISFAGVFYEILAYNKVLSQSERQTVEGYLAWKWGLQASLPEGHAFVSAAPETNQTVVPRKAVLQLDARNYSGEGAWLDESGSENDATLEAGTIAVNGAGNGIVLNGSTSWTLPNLALGGTWTVNVWYKDNGTTGQILPSIISQIVTQVGVLSNMLIVYEGYNNNAWIGGDGYNPTAQFTLTSGQWTNIQVTNDGSFMTLYINGVNSGATALGAPSVDNGNAYRIGATYDDPAVYGYVTGEIGAINVYNYAAGQTQVQAEYAASLQNYGFNPTAITGLQAWYDATDPLGTGATVADAAEVPTWADKSSNAVSAAATGTPTLAKGSQNRLPGISFPLSPQTYFTASIPTRTFSSATAFFVVYKSRQIASYNTLVTRGSSTSLIANPDMYNNYPAIVPIYQANSGTAPLIKFYQGSDLYNAIPSLFNVAVDQYGNSALEWLNGALYPTTESTTTPLNPNTADSVQNQLLIGTRSVDLISQFCGTYNEILAFSSVPSESERQTIEGYLAWKWGLQSTLPANHPYYSNPLPPTPITTTPRKALLLLKAVNYTGTGAWSDESGNGNDATLLSGNITKNTDGNGIALDGQTAWTFPNVALPNEWSVNVWYKNTQDASAAIIGQQTPGGSNSNMALLLDGNNLTGVFADAAAYRVGTSVTIPAHAWTNVQVTWNGQDMITYVNGANVGTSRIASALTLNTGVYYIGCSYNQANFVTGEIGEVRIYNYAIGPQKVQQDYLQSRNTFNLTNPLDISGCQLWLDGADLTSISSTGTAVTQWNDKSGNDNNTSGTTGTPLLNSNGTLSGVIFDGASYLALPDGTIPYGDSSYTIYIVANINNQTDDSTLLAAGDDGEGASTNVIRAANTSSLFVSWANLLSTGVFTPSSPFLMTTNYQSEGNASLYLNGTLDNTASGPGPRTQTNTLNFIGAQPGGEQPLTGTIYEVLVYNSVHNTEQQQLIEGYLAYKWSTQGQLPLSHAYYNYPPATLPVAFEPSKLTNLGLWLDGKRISPSATAGNPVSGWIDWSYNGYDATQTVVENQPTAVAGGGVYFSSVAGATMALSQVAPFSGSVSIFCVTSNSSGGPSYLYTTDNNTTAILINYNETTPSISGFNITNGGGAECEFVTPGTTLAPINLFNFTRIDNTSASGYYMGAETFNISSMLSSPPGGINGLSSSFDGTIYEFVVFQRALSDTERQQMEGYLAWKWGIQASLVEGHPYSSAAP